MFGTLGQKGPINSRSRGYHVPVKAFAFVADKAFAETEVTLTVAVSGGGEKKGGNRPEPVKLLLRKPRSSSRQPHLGPPPASAATAT